MEITRFKSNPYNSSNVLITSTDIMNIMKSLNIHDFKINNLSLYQTAFVHKSYCFMKDYEEFDKWLEELAEKNGTTLYYTEMN